MLIIYANHFHLTVTGGKKKKKLADSVSSFVSNISGGDELTIGGAYPVII